MTDYSCVDLSFLQMFLWERFHLTDPNPIMFHAVNMEEMILADGFKGTKPSNTHKFVPRAWR